MNKKLINISNLKRDTAYEIISQTNIKDIFSKLGTIEIVGSLKLDLMYRNDIDILVISDNIDIDRANNITFEILNGKQFQTVAFANHINNSNIGIPSGIYWELIYIHNNENWKFDIWYIKPDEEYTKKVLNSIKVFQKELNKYPVKREIILQKKKQYFDGVKYINNINSIDIYNEVLLGK